MRFLTVLFLTILILISLAESAFCEFPDTTDPSLFVNWPFRNTNPDDLTIKLAEVGPGEDFFLWFGHTGFIVEDSAKGESYFYDFGVFSFDDKNFLSNFIFGKFIYSVESTKFIYYIMRIKSINRSLHTLTLNLDKEIKVELAKKLYLNSKPPNNEYNYRHFDNNCSTIIRDYIDYAVYGQLKKTANNTSARMTLREHLRRHTYHNFFADWMYMFILSGIVDKPATGENFTAWDEMYIPSEIERNINNFKYINIDGKSVPLVIGREEIYKGEGRPPVLENYIELWPSGLIAGIILALIPIILTLIYLKYNRLGLILGLYTCIIGFFFGILGSLLFFMDNFTAHFVMFNNENLFIINPLTLAALPLGILFMLKKKTAPLLLFIVWGVITLLCLAMLILKLFGIFYQSNMLIISTCVPFNFGFAVSYFLLVIKKKRVFS